jgi:hypothetical protein
MELKYRLGRLDPRPQLGFKKMHPRSPRGLAVGVVPITDYQAPLGRHRQSLCRHQITIRRGF